MKKKLYIDYDDSSEEPFIASPYSTDIEEEEVMFIKYNKEKDPLHYSYKCTSCGAGVEFGWANVSSDGMFGYSEVFCDTCVEIIN